MGRERGEASQPGLAHHSSNLTGPRQARAGRRMSCLRTAPSTGTGAKTPRKNRNGAHSRSGANEGAAQPEGLGWVGGGWEGGTLSGALVWAPQPIAPRHSPRGCLCRCPCLCAGIGFCTHARARACAYRTLARYKPQWWKTALRLKSDRKTNGTIANVTSVPLLVRCILCLPRARCCVTLAAAHLVQQGRSCTNPVSFLLLLLTLHAPSPAVLDPPLLAQLVNLSSPWLAPPLPPRSLW